MIIKIKSLEEKLLATFSKNLGLTDAKMLTDYVMWAEMSGINTQGLVKMMGKEAYQNIQPKYQTRVERDNGIAELLDGGGNPAPVACQIGVRSAIKKCSEFGIGIIGVRNTFSSNGAQAFYLEKIAAEGYLGFMCSRSPPSTTGFNSIDPLFGTNPLGMSFPTDGDPFVFDMATSAMTFYGLVIAKAKGEEIPSNVAFDREGNITVDPAAAMEGALLPFDRSYKSSSLSLMVEVLAGPFLASLNGEPGSREWGTLILAINPGLLTDSDKFKYNTSALLRKIQTSRPQKSGDPIRLPGERARQLRQSCELSGEVEVDGQLLEKLGYV